MAKKNPGSTPARNASAEGFEAENIFIEKLAKHSDVTQCYYKPNGLKSRFIKYKIVDLCTSLKFTVGGIAMTENDCNLTLKADYEVISKITRHFYGIDSLENVAIQSKLYSGKVDTGHIKHDGTNILITPMVSSNLLERSVLAADNLPLSYAKKLKDYGVKVVSPDKFARNYETILEMGNNIIGFDKFENGKHVDYSIKLGELRLMRLPFGKIGFINAISLDMIEKNPLKKKISAADEKLDALLAGFNAQVTYLNPEYYIYSTKTGQIDREGREFLEDMNAKESTYDEVDKAFSNGEFFKEFKRIDHAPYAIGEIILGSAKWEMLDRLKVSLREKGLKIAHKKIQNAIDSFLID